MDDLLSQLSSTGNEDTNKFVDNTADTNTHNHMQSSEFSSSSSEIDLSFALTLDSKNLADSDELPVFEIPPISPIARSPSPLQTHSGTHGTHLPVSSSAPSQEKNCSEFVALADINAQISRPTDCDADTTPLQGLETIYEGVFLNTPPRKSCNSFHSIRKRSKSLENLPASCLAIEKENSSSAANKMDLTRMELDQKSCKGDIRRELFRSSALRDKDYAK